MTNPHGHVFTTAAELRPRAANISLLLLDVDGVLTDGSITYTQHGDEIKQFHVRDGSAIKIWQSLGLQVAILSGRNSQAVDRRAKELGIGIVHQGRSDKYAALPEILDTARRTASEVCAVGDDLPDLPLILKCGLGVAVADACLELQSAASYTTKAPGGQGAVRETIEWLLKLRGQWADVVEHYGKLHG